MLLHHAQIRLSQTGPKFCMPMRGTASVLYRRAWYDVKCDTAYWAVLLNCEPYALAHTQGRVVFTSVRACPRAKVTAFQ